MELLVTLIDAFETDKLTVIRNTTASHISDETGRQIEGQFEKIEIVGVVREDGFISKNENKGIFNVQTLVVYTDRELFTDRDRRLDADCVIYNDCSYKVVSVINNMLTDLPHYKSVIEKMEVVA
jgi:hypothetical protein